VARALIVGCGCHGRELGSELLELGWQVRGTSRRPQGLDLIKAAGLEPAAADPDRAGTVLELCADVAVVVWLLGSAAGESELTAAIHGPRLKSLLEKLVDSPVRGFAYEMTGTVGGEVLGEGTRLVEEAGETWHIPVTLLSGDRGEAGWATRAAPAVAALLTG
jgi:nucleoside-diphosphate-sugar epimerase